MRRPFLLGTNVLVDQKVLFFPASSDRKGHPLWSYASACPCLTIAVAVLGLNFDASEFGRTLGWGFVCRRFETLAASFGLVLGCLEIGDGDAKGFHIGLDVGQCGCVFFGLDLRGFLLELGDLGLEGK